MFRGSFAALRLGHLLSAGALVLALAGGVSRAQALAKSGAPFRDCADCPSMVVVPAGSFTMGAPAGELLPGAGPSGAIEQGTPQVVIRAGQPRPAHRVTFARPFAIARLEVSRKDFAAFVAATRFQQDGNDCLLNDAGPDSNLLGQDIFAFWQAVRNSNWQYPPWPSSPDEPVTCVNRGDAEAYAAWLRSKTGKRYRLPSEAEWEYAARAGSAGAWPWGRAVDACRFENLADRSFLRQRWRSPTAVNHFDCDDGHPWNAPVGRFAANAFGIHDMIGNVAEWVADCWHDDYGGAPADGSAWTRGGDCRFAVLRGDQGMISIGMAQAAARRGVPAQQYRATTAGFRLVRDLDP